MEFIKFPIFMKRRKKLEILNAMIESIDKSARKMKCDICEKKFTKEDSRWSKCDFLSSICILCHSKYFHKPISEYMSHEQKEIRKLKKSRHKTKQFKRRNKGK